MESKRFSRVNSLKATSPDDPGVERFEGAGGRAGRQAPSAATGGHARQTHQGQDGRQSGIHQTGYSARVVDLGGSRRPYMEPRVDQGTSHVSPKIGDIESPAWQEYFFLAPNVRFTRTPDYETKKHRQQSDPVVEQGAPDALPTQQAVTQPIVDKAPVAPSLLALPVSVKSRNLETARLQGSSEPAASRTSPPAAASAAPGRANDKARRVPSVPPMTAATG